MPFVVFIGIVICVLVLMEGFFSGSETVFTSVSRAYVHTQAAEGDRSAVLTERFILDSESFLGTTLMGTNIAVVSATTLSQQFIAGTLVSSACFQAFIGYFGEPAADWSSIMNTLLMTPIILLMGELVPKSIGRARADTLAFKLIHPLRVAGIVLKPLVLFTAGIAGQLSRILGCGTTPGLIARMTRDDLRIIAKMATEQGLLPESAGEMLRTVFELDTKPLSSMMVALVDVRLVQIDSTVAEVEKLSVETGFSRFPVYQDRIDEIIGLVDIREIMYASDQADSLAVPPDESIRQFVHKDIAFVPETKPVSELLYELRYRKDPMVGVVDEHGGVVGILTTEDVVEEVVGEIHDERDNTEHGISKVTDSVYECDGKFSIDQLCEILDIEVENDGFETVAGLVLKFTGRIPEAGERLVYQGYEIKVVKVSGRRISALRFSRLPVPPK